MTHDDDSPTVLFLPDFRGSNPYQSNLASALEDREIEVSFEEVGGLGRIWRTVRAVGDVDVVHLHWLAPYIQGVTRTRTLVLTVLTAIQLLVLRRLGVGVVWTVHNLTPHESTFAGFERRMVGLVVRTCDRFVVHCEAVGTELAERYGRGRTAPRTTVVPHGHFIDNYRNVVSKSEALDALTLEGADTVFLYFGRVRRYKGANRLIEAFKDVADEDSRLLIVGAPHDREFAEEIERMAGESSRVNTVLEFVPSDDVQVYMNAADAVVLPYRDIATAGAAVLAMSFGKAVITPATGCNPELIGDADGLLYAAGADDGLSEAIRVAETLDLDAIGERNRQTIRTNDWNRIAERTEQVYLECR